jgi:TolB-like protein/Flp pilus assembly protein TadD
VAVLPLANLSGDPEQEYFADGMTEALITDLAKISALRVISRTSVMRYKGARRSLAEVARELRVDAVVEGSVLRVGDRVRITAELIHGLSDTHLWAERYERDLRDVLALQGEVAQAIAAEIRVKVRPQERARLRSARSVVREAHEAYLMGRYFWNKRTPDSSGKSLEQFQKAIELDPGSALAFAGVAEAYAIAGSIMLEVISPKEAMPKAEAAAKRALEIDETLGEAHATLAYASAVYRYDWEEAERRFLQALTLNPGDATARQLFALHWAYRGDSDRAFAEIERAREIDPLSLQINTEVANILYLGRDYDRSIRQAKKTLELDARFFGAHLILALAYRQKGLLEDALWQAERAAELSAKSTASLGCIGGCQAALGNSRQAKKIIDELRELSKAKFVPSFVTAWIHANLGDKEATLESLEAAYAQRSSYMAVIGAEPALDFIRSDPRFQDLQRRVGLRR